MCVYLFNFTVIFLGILTQETLYSGFNLPGDYYLDGNYVEYVQSSGAKVVPIKYVWPITLLAGCLRLFRNFPNFWNCVKIVGFKVFQTEY